MRAFLRAVFTAILCLSMILCTGCGDFFKDYSPDGTTTQPGDEGKSDDPIKALGLARRPNQITILIAAEGADTGSLSSLSLLCIDDSGEPKISVLQIPTTIYARSGGTLGGYYEMAFNRSAADGSNLSNSVSTAMSALKSFIQNTLLIRIDYTVHLNASQLAGIVDTVGGVEMVLPRVMSLGGHNVQAGRQTLSGAELADLRAYTGFSPAFYNDMVMGKLLITGIIGSLKSNIDKSILSLCAMELRTSMTTDITSVGGADVFLVRRLIETSFSSISFTSLAAEPFSTGVTILCRETAADQLTSFVNLYTSPIPVESIDAQTDLCDPSDSFMVAVYNSTSAAPTSYTAEQIRSGALKME